MITAISLGELIKMNNPRRQVINLKDYKIDPRDFEDTPEKPKTFKRNFKKDRPLLTAKEQEIATLFCVGYSQREAARKLGYSDKNIGSCIRRTRQKLGVWDREQIANRLTLMGVVLPPPPNKVEPTRCPLWNAVKQALRSEMPVPFEHKGRADSLRISACHYAEEMGGRVAVRTVDNKLWIFRRAA